MKTFFEIDQKPEVGMVCLNPTSRFFSVILEIGDWYKWSGPQKTVTILNDHHNIQRIEYDTFCERYCYQGISVETCENFYVSKKITKADFNDKKEVEVGDVCINKRSQSLCVVTDVSGDGKRKYVKCASETGVTIINELEKFKRNYNYTGECAVNLNTVFMMKKHTDKSVWQMLKDKFKRKV